MLTNLHPKYFGCRFVSFCLFYYSFKAANPNAEIGQACILHQDKQINRTIQASRERIMIAEIAFSDSVAPISDINICNPAIATTAPAMIGSSHKKPLLLAICVPVKENGPSVT
jgi:hypothetical protein